MYKRQVRGIQRSATDRRQRRLGGDTATATLDVIVLVCRLDSDDHVSAVGNHHVRNLIQRLACDLDTVDFHNLVIDGQQSGALGNATGNKTRDEDRRDFLHPVWSNTDARTVADVESKWLVGINAGLHQPNPALCCWNYVDVDDRGDAAEILRQ